MFNKKFAGGASTYSVNAKRAEKSGTLFQRTKKYALILLILLCTVLLGCAFIAPFLPKDKVKSASAASETANPVTIALTDTKVWWVGSRSPWGITYASMSDSISGCDLYATLADNVVSFGGSSNSAYVGRCVFAEVTASVTVPAMEQYTVDYQLVYSAAKRKSLASGLGVHVFNYGFSNDTVTAPTAATAGSAFSDANSAYTLDYGYCSSSGMSVPQKTLNVTGVVYKNETFEPQTFIQRFAVWSGEGYGSGTYYGSLSITPTVNTFEQINYTVPENIEVEYDSSDYYDLALPAYTNSGWYSPAGMTLSFADGITEMRDAGEYGLSASIKSEAVALGTVWIHDDGTTDTDDKQTKFIIKKKRLKLKEIVLDEDFKPVDPLALDDTVPGNQIFGRDDGKISFKLRYTKTSGGYDSYDAPSVLRGGTGLYNATAEIVDESGNYELIPYSITFTISKKAVSLPTLVSDASQPFTGENVEFSFTGVKEFYEIIADGMTVGEVDDLGNCTLTAVNAGNYTVSFKLKDWENTEWDAAAGGGTASKTLEGGLTVTPKQITVTASATAVNWTWKRGSVVVVTVRAAGVTEADAATLEFKATYTKAGGVPVPVAIAYNADDKGYKITMPKNLQLGSYTLEITLASASETNSSGNYTCTAVSKPFEVTAPDANFTESDLVWQFTVGDKVVQLGEDDFVLDGDELQLDYTGEEYTISVYDELLEIDYFVKVSGYTGTVKATDCGSYQISVTIVKADSSVTFPDTTFTLKFKINQAKIDTSALKWQWQYVGDTEWRNFSDGMPVFKSGYAVKTRVDVDNLPKGLSAADFEIEEEKPLPNALGSHQTTIAFKPQLADGNYARPNDFTFEWEITKKLINVTTWISGVLPDANGDECAVKVIDCHEQYENVIKYLYSFSYTDENGQLQTVTDMEGAEALGLLNKYADKDNAISVEVRVELTDTANYEFAPSAVLSSKFNAGDGLTQVKVEITGSGSTFGEVSLGVTATLKDGTPVNKDFYVVKIFDGNDNLIAELTPDQLKNPEEYGKYLKDAGDYIVKAELNALGEANGYYLSGSTVSFKISPKLIAVPSYSEITFTGEEILLEDYFSDEFKQLIADGIVTITGGGSNRNAGDYKAYFNIIDKNYAWETAAADQPQTAAFKVTAQDKAVINGSELILTWIVNKAKLSTDGWNLKSSDGATLDALSAWQEKINSGIVNIGLEYRYYDNGKNLLESVEFKGGLSLFVDAVLCGEDAENFEFIESADGNKQISAMVEYKVPKKGLGAIGDIAGTAVDFVKKNWLWFAIGLGALILLIILIIIISAARRNKDKREEKKAARADAREAAKAKQEAELELAKARQEAELAKIRAQAASVMPAAATAAMSQQAQPQQMQQMQQAQQPSRQMPQMPQYQMPMQMPQQMPQYQLPQQMPQQNGGEGMMIAMLQAQIAEMRALQNAAFQNANLKTELEVLKSRVDGNASHFEYRHVDSDRQANNGLTAELLGNAILNALSKVVTSRAALPEYDQQIVRNEPPVIASTPTVYPPDAVVTTTTVVDSTKKPTRLKRGNTEREFDIDGFYDTFDK